jgi:hypothetical protein
MGIYLEAEEGEGLVGTILLQINLVRCFGRKYKVRDTLENFLRKFISPFPTSAIYRTETYSKGWSCNADTAEP